MKKCIQVSPDKRFQTAEELKSALTGKRRSKAFPISILLIVLAVDVCIIIAVSSNDKASQNPNDFSLQNETSMITNATSAMQTSENTKPTTTTVQTETTTVTTTSESISQETTLELGDYITEGKTLSQIQGYGGYEDIGGTVLTIEEITDTTLTFSIVQYNESGYALDTTSARNITAILSNNTAEFTFTDMLDGKGTGRITLENGKIHIETWGDTDRPTTIILNEYLN